jgi:hypothetical protein
MGWAGCGQHVEQVLKGIPPEGRCQGHAKTGGGFFARFLKR